MGQRLTNVIQKDCPFCEGRGKVLSEESVSLSVKKEIFSVCESTLAPAVLVEANPAVASYLIGTGGQSLRILEQRAYKKIMIKGVAGMRMEETIIRPVYDLEEIEKQSVPVKVGQKIHVKVEEPHAGHQMDGIARVEGFVIDIEEGGALVGQEVWVEIKQIYRTYAKAFVISSS